VRIESCGKWFACGSNAMAGLAIVHDISMIKVSVSEILSVMARSTISGSVSMSLSIRRRFGVNASASIVAGFTRLVRCIKQGVVENTAGHFETHDAMTADAIDACYRMADRLPFRLTSTISNMAGITCYTRTHNVRAGMVGVGIQKTGRGMTVTAIGVGVWVVAGWGVG